MSESKGEQLNWLRDRELYDLGGGSFNKAIEVCMKLETLRRTGRQLGHLEVPPE